MMITLLIVKNSFLLPALLLFYSLIFLVFLTSISVFFLIISNHVNMQQVSGGYILSYLTYSLIEVLPGTILCAVIVTFFRILKNPGNRLLSYLLMIITATGLLAGGAMVFHLIPPVKTGGQHTLSSLMKEKSFYSMDEVILYADEIQGNSLVNNLLADF